MATNLFDEAQDLTAAALATKENNKQKDKIDKKAEYESKYMADFLQEAEKQIMTKAKEGLSAAFVPFPDPYFSNEEAEIFLESVVAQPVLVGFTITIETRTVEVNRKSVSYSAKIVHDGLEFKW